jgi:hypothetical protein
MGVARDLARRCGSPSVLIGLVRVGVRIATSRIVNLH